MRAWALLLGGFIVWAAHFFVLYGIASIFPRTSLANTLSLIATIPALAANAGLLWLSAARRLAGGDQVDAWILDVAAIGAGLSLVAVVWQALPAIVL